MYYFVKPKRGEMLDYKDLPEISGVYLIWCSANNKPYVGQSINIRQRIKRHLGALLCGKHYNKKFQNCFNKHGIESFDVFVVYVCEEQYLTRVEQDWIDNIRLDIAFAEYLNISPTAESPRGCTWSEESKKKASESHTGKKLSEHHVERVRQGLLGKTHSSERVAKTVESNKEHYEKRAKEYSLISPDDVIYTGTNIGAFAREHGLSPGTLSRLISGKKLFYNGWRVYPPATDEISRDKTATFRSPTGEIVTVVGMSKFARTLGFSDSGFSMLRSGNIKSFHGWTLVNKV